jgi:DNA invertase Pin-like site-specific DNA recombinase
MRSISSTLARIREEHKLQQRKNVISRIIQIRKEHPNIKPIQYIAKEMGISRSTIYRMIYND